MKILIAPLNWGLGHASRCIPLVIDHLRAGHEVMLAGDGDALLLLRRHFPRLRTIPLAPLSLRYGSGQRQVWPMLRVLPRLLRWAVRDHRALEAVLREEHFDRVISDNRFGCFSRHAHCVYITHQLHIMLPHPWQWLEPLAERLHLCIARHYDECWVPDYEGDPNLSGRLSHHVLPQWNGLLTYIGPLSRFSADHRPSAPAAPTAETQLTLAILSGLEPQRTMLEQSLIREWSTRSDELIIVGGTIAAPPTRWRKKNITRVPYMSDAELLEWMQRATHIIARSGYSTIMDLHAIGLLAKAQLIPTPGQPEQEYLATRKENHKITIT